MKINIKKLEKDFLKEVIVLGKTYKMPLMVMENPINILNILLAKTLLILN